MKLDWITASNQTVDNPLSLLLLLGIPAANFRPTPGRYFFTEGVSYAGISIYYGGAVNKGVCVVISGKGIAELVSRGRNPQAIASDMQASGYKFSRLDYCQDVPYDRLQTVYDAIRNDLIVTRCRKISMYTGFEKGKEVGVTLAFGSRSSDRYLRIYDKGYEQGGDPFRVARFEVELKNPKRLLTPQEASYMMSDVFCVVVSRGSNVSRAERVVFWDTVLDEITELEKIAKVESGLEYFRSLIPYIRRSIQRWGLSSLVNSACGVPRDRRFAQLRNFGFCC